MVVFSGLSRPSLPRDHCLCPSKWKRLPGFVLPFVVLSTVLSFSPARAQDSATVGQWSPTTDWPFRAVHANLLPTGNVLFWPAFAQGDNPRVWNPATNLITTPPKAGANIFCAGHAFLPDGRLLVAGGH